jgi:tRNA U34 5-methylaminomethyl-2-thiouridine-forming methyltransferase MnmC
MLPEIQLTKDHSHTLYVAELDETYHSRNGAVEEALYVYIGRGLQDWEKSRQPTDRSQQLEVNSKNPSIDPVDGFPHDTVNRGPLTDSLFILEVGFGTGLNAWLTALESEKLGINCTYHSLETYPLSVELIQQLNYTAEVSDIEKALFQQMHEAEWNTPIEINPHFKLNKLNLSLQEFSPSSTYDVIYFDAFAPEKQPELWTRELFQKLYDCLNPNGIIVTYSSKGDVKRLWREIGFEVERLPGPPMKRHMLRGRKFTYAKASVNEK